jgi:hypothetical protein
LRQDGIDWKSWFAAHKLHRSMSRPQRQTAQMAKKIARRTSAGDA